MYLLLGWCWHPCILRTPVITFLYKEFSIYYLYQYNWIWDMFYLFVSQRKLCIDLGLHLLTMQTLSGNLLCSNFFNLFAILKTYGWINKNTIFNYQFLITMTIIISCWIQRFKYRVGQMKRINQEPKTVHCIHRIKLFLKYTVPPADFLIWKKFCWYYFSVALQNI